MFSRMCDSIKLQSPESRTDREALPQVVVAVSSAVRGADDTGVLPSLRVFQPIAAKCQPHRFPLGVRFIHKLIAVEVPNVLE
jgi:hypothetical protein